MRPVLYVVQYFPRCRVRVHVLEQGVRRKYFQDQAQSQCTRLVGVWRVFLASFLLCLHNTPYTKNSYVWCSVLILACGVCFGVYMPLYSVQYTPMWRVDLVCGVWRITLKIDWQSTARIRVPQNVASQKSNSRKHPVTMFQKVARPVPKIVSKLGFTLIGIWNRMILKRNWISK
jgi:hypothetical protein